MANRITSNIELRAMAEANLKQASCTMMRAFNLASDPAIPYTFPPEVRARAEEHLAEIIGLHSRSRAQARSGAAIQGNAEFQRFMVKVAG